MTSLRPNTNYRLYRTDRTTIDFRTLEEVPIAKHLIEVKTKEHERYSLFELLAEKGWIEVVEIDNSIADL